jgi:restriction endonuclease S subunit
MNQNSKFLMLYCGHKKKDALNIWEGKFNNNRITTSLFNLKIPSPMFYFHTLTKVLPYFTTKLLGCN